MRDITNLFRDLSRIIENIYNKEYFTLPVDKKNLYFLNKFIMRTMNRYLYFLTNYFFIYFFISYFIHKIFSHNYSAFCLYTTGHEAC